MNILNSFKINHIWLYDDIFVHDTVFYVNLIWFGEIKLKKVLTLAFFWFIIITQKIKRGYL